MGALISSFIALCFVVSSYFFKERIYYLLFQSLCIVFLILSYLFDGNYFAMVGLIIGLGRVLVYFLYERKNVVAPVWVAVLICLATLSAYCVVNLWILKNAKPLDILNLALLCLYAVIMRIRNMELLRWLIVIPTAMAILYNALCGAAVFAVISYVFEVCANIYAIVKFNILEKRTKKTPNAKTPT